MDRVNVKMIPQACQGKDLIDGCRVAHEMNVALGEVKDSLAGLVGHECLADVPLIGDSPVQHLLTCRNFVDTQVGYKPLQFPQGLSNSVSGDTAIDRKQFTSDVVEELTFRNRGMRIGV